MPDDLNAKQITVVTDLLREKSLWQVYVASRRIPFSKVNLIFGIAIAIVVTAFALARAEPSSIADQLLILSVAAFSTAIAQLGFLLAGFSFFATIADKSMFCRMAEVRHQQSGLSYLKYNFFVFMRVFVEYLAFSIVSLGMMVCLTKGVGAREWCASFCDRLAWPVGLAVPFTPTLLIASSALGLFVGCFVYLLMQLKSFIFNVYHVVMTSIRWALEDEYRRANEASDNAKAEGTSTKSHRPN